MLDHLALQTDDAAAAAAFYARVFAALGVHESMRIERPEGLVIGMAGPDGFPHLCSARSSTPASGRCTWR